MLLNWLRNAREKLEIFSLKNWLLSDTHDVCYYVINFLSKNNGKKSSMYRQSIAQSAIRIIGQLHSAIQIRFSFELRVFQSFHTFCLRRFSTLRLFQEFSQTKTISITKNFSKNYGKETPLWKNSMAV